MRRTLYSCILVIFMVFSAFSQNCGTVIPKNFFSNQKNMAVQMKTIAGVPFKDLPHVNLGISVYLSYGADVDSAKIYNVIDALNIAFEPSGLSFSACKIEFIKETGFNEVTDSNEERLSKLYQTKNTINLYLTEKVSPGGEAVCGYTYLPSDDPKDIIFISTKECGISATLIHEMGHFFGLLHPHETLLGKELVNGSNCNSAGDYICDTEASPNLLGLVSSNCEYTGIKQDSNGDYYLPSVANYMAYSPDKCQCIFTPEQYQRMVDFYWLYRTYLR